MEEENKNIKKQKKKHFNIFNLIINLIVTGIVVVFIALLYFSFTNFNLVKDGNNPSGYKNTKEYVTDGKEVTVYNYTVYKIVVVKEDEQTTYLLRPTIFTDF